LFYSNAKLTFQSDLVSPETIVSPAENSMMSSSRNMEEGGAFEPNSRKPFAFNLEALEGDDNQSEGSVKLRRERNKRQDTKGPPIPKLDFKAI